MKGSTTTNSVDFYKIDNELINYLLAVGGIFGLIIFVISFAEGPLLEYRTVQVLALLGVFTLYLFRRRISTQAKANSCIIFILLVAFNGVIRSGPQASVTLFLIIIPLICLLVYQKRVSMLIYSVVLLGFLLLGWMGKNYWPSLEPHTHFYLWFDQALILMLVGTLVHFFLSTYIRSLKKSLLVANDNVDALILSQRELEQTKSLLEKAIAHSPSGIMIADADSVT